MAALAGGSQGGRGGVMAVGMSLREAAARANPWLAALLALSLPVSTSAMSVFACLLFLSWLLSGDHGRKLREIGANPVCLAVLAYLALHLLGLLWTADRAGGLDMLGKLWKLLLLPVVLTALQPGDRHRVLNFFLAGLTVTMVTTYLAWFDLYHVGGVSPAHPTRGLFHVVYNPMLAFGCYLALHEAVWGGGGPRRRTGYLLLALALGVDMFITEGRAGQLAFFILLTLLLLQYFRRRILWGVAAAVVLIPLLFTAGYQLSPTFRERVDAVGHEIAVFDRNPDTSVGLRLLFWRNTWRLIKMHPFVGFGTGDFHRAYKWINMQFSPAMVATDNPHNQYVLVLCQLGLLGLTALLAIFALQIRAAVGSRDDLRRLRLAFPILFLTIMLTESYLIVYETGIFFAVMSGVLYKRDEIPAGGEG